MYLSDDYLVKDMIRSREAAVYRQTKISRLLKQAEAAQPVEYVSLKHVFKMIAGRLVPHAHRAA